MGSEDLDLALWKGELEHQSGVARIASRESRKERRERESTEALN
jgi:hypothetical protein